MIIEHDISKEQRKKKKKNKKNENPSSPIDEDEDLQGKMEEKGEIMEDEQPTFAMEERVMENHSSPANSSPPQPSCSH